MRLFELQNHDKKAKKLRSKKLQKGWEDIKEVLYYQSFPYILKIICLKLISRYYDNFLIYYFGIKKT